MELRYRKDIDGIRAFAVLSVLLFHAFPAVIPGGFIGVDVFFVISGFLISNMIIVQMSKGQFGWLAFYIKRINRIIPALIIILASALIGGYFLLFADEYQNLSKHVLGSVFFLNNFLLWKEAGYFDISSDLKPLLHLWSLGIEEQFYLVWPFFIFLIWTGRIRLFVGILILFISFLINVLAASHHSVAVFYLPVSRFWELGLGGGVAYLLYLRSIDPESEVADKSISALNLLSIFSFSILLFSIFYFNSSFIYPGWAVLVPTLCTGILLCTPASWVNRSLLTLPVLTLIGVISYPLYLWHWELLSFARIVLSGKLPNHLIIALLMVSFCLAWLTYQFIEKPIRFSLMGKKHASLIAILSGITLVSIGLSAMMIYNKQGLEARSLAQIQKSFTHDINDFEQYRAHTYPCKLANDHGKNLDWCVQTSQRNPDKVIWGDSHADHLMPGLLKYASQDNWLLLGKSSCPPLLGVQGFWIGFEDTCTKANKTALQIILESPAIDTVVLASLGPFYVSDQGYAVQHLGQYSPSGYVLQSEKNGRLDKNKPKVFYDGLDLTISTLLKAGKKVIIFQDVPEIPFMPTRCLHRPLAPDYPCLVHKDDVLKRQKIYKSVLTKLEKRHPELLVFDPLDFMCTTLDCQLTDKQHLIYRDSHHLSSAGSHFLGKHFINWLTQQSELSTKPILG